MHDWSCALNEWISLSSLVSNQQASESTIALTLVERVLSLFIIHSEVGTKRSIRSFTIRFQLSMFSVERVDPEEKISFLQVLSII
tara:strand:+ start:7369 stop:7623 length:255 start_codon:yes stop_codon:yes gene_type:complete